MTVLLVHFAGVGEASGSQVALSGAYGTGSQVAQSPQQQHLGSIQQSGPAHSFQSYPNADTAGLSLEGQVSQSAQNPPESAVLDADESQEEEELETRYVFSSPPDSLDLSGGSDGDSSKDELESDDDDDGDVFVNCPCGLDACTARRPYGKPGTVKYYSDHLDMPLYQGYVTYGTFYALRMYY
jgi:hypothetical protein